MNYTKKEVEGAILVFAKYLAQEESYKALMKINYGLPTLVKDIVYQMFLHRFTPIDCSPELNSAYFKILAFADELQHNGTVNFKA